MKNFEQFAPSEKEDRELMRNWDPSRSKFTDEDTVNEQKEEEKGELVYQ